LSSGPRTPDTGPTERGSGRSSSGAQDEERDVVLDGDDLPEQEVAEVLDMEGAGRSGGHVVHQLWQLNPDE
jgi:hypothetical protein